MDWARSRQAVSLRVRSLAISLSEIVIRCHPVQAGTISIWILRPRALAAFSRVVKVIEGLVRSSNRSTAARLVFIRVAISVLDTASCWSKALNWRDTAFFSAAASTCSKMPCSRKKSRKSEPRCFRLCIFFQVFALSFLCQSQFREGRSLLLFDKAMEQYNFFVDYDEYY